MCISLDIFVPRAHLRKILRAQIYFVCSDGLQIRFGEIRSSFTVDSRCFNVFKNLRKVLSMGSQQTHAGSW